MSDRDSSVVSSNSITPTESTSDGLPNDKLVKLGQALLPIIKGRTPDTLCKDMLRILPTNDYGDKVHLRTEEDCEIFILIMLLMDEEKVEDSYIVDTPKLWSELKINECVNKVQMTRLILNLSLKDVVVMFRSIYSMDTEFMDYRLRLLHYKYYSLTNKKLTHKVSVGDSSSSNSDNVRMKDFNEFLFRGTFRKDTVLRWFQRWWH
jgi:hypothetical protein